MDESDAMRITGHRTREVFARYDLTNVEQLRERLTRARQLAGRARRVVSLTERRRQGAQGA
jgi:hypothetical protein